jgi:hypothetical protein
LLLQQLAEPAKFLRSKLPGQTELGLLYRDMGRVDALIEDILLASLDSCILEGEDPLPRDGAGLMSLAERKRGSLDRACRAGGAADAGDPQALARSAKALQGQDRSGPGRGVERHQAAVQQTGVPGFCARDADAVAQGDCRVT